MKPDPESIGTWSARAPAYDRFCRRWKIFSLLSNRLIDLLPPELEGPVLDIGAGTGLTSELLLARFPNCQAILIEPSEAMLDIARVSLGGRPAQFFVMGLDQVPAHGLRAGAALASASMQFLDLESAFAVLKRVIAPQGHVAFNLWWHHWEETAATKGMAGWHAIAQAACREAQLPPLADPAPPKSKPKTRTEILSASHKHGFELLSVQCDEDLTPVGVGLDFEAMSTDWPARGLQPEARLALVEKMHELARGRFETVASTRFLFRRSV